MRSAPTRLAGSIVAMVVFVAGCTAGSTDDGDAASGSTVQTTGSGGSTTLTTGPAVEADSVLGLTGDVTPVHDPDIAQEGDWYYVFHTGEGIPIKRSRDLANWEDVGSVFDEPMPAWIDYEWVEPGGGLGAPDVEWFDGRWHVYYHAHQFATNNAVTGHASNVTLNPDDPDYEWIDDGLVMSSDTTNDYSVLDASAVVDTEGNPWLSFGSFWSGIKLIELDPATGAPLAGAEIHDLASRDPSVLGIEASSMAYRDGYWYLFVTFGICCQGVDTPYEMRVGRSQNITGPYVDAAGRPMLGNGGSLLVASHGRVRGPGSGDALVDDNDSWLVHHWYDPDNDGEPTLGVRPLLWSSDGWPIAADPGFEAAGPETIDAASIAGTWTLSEYYAGREAALGLDPDGTLTGGRGTWEHDPVTGVVKVSIEGECPSLSGRNHVIVIGSDLRSGFGYNDAAFAVRAERSADSAQPTC